MIVSARAYYTINKYISKGSEAMILGIDVGNTNITLGIFDGKHGDCNDEKNSVTGRFSY